MAPRRGGSSSGDGYDDSSTICEYCSDPLNLTGSDWQDDWSIPYLILACTSLAAYLYAARLCFKHPITRNEVKDKRMTRTLRTAVVCAILTCCLSIVQTTLYEERASLTQAYHIEYIFSYFVTSVAEFLLLVPITYLILDHASYQAYAMKMLKFVTSTTLLAILGASTASIVGYTLFNVTAFTHLTNTDGYYTIALIANVTYTSLCTALTLELLVLARIVLVRSLERLKLRIFWTTLTTLLFLRNLFGLIDVVSSYRSTYAGRNSAASQPNLFMYLLLGAACFTLLGLIVREQQVKRNTGST